jgi:hypothetical protein
LGTAGGDRLGTAGGDMLGTAGGDRLGTGSSGTSELLRASQKIRATFCQHTALGNPRSRRTRLADATDKRASGVNTADARLSFASASLVRLERGLPSG